MLTYRLCHAMSEDLRIIPRVSNISQELYYLGLPMRWHCAIA